MKSKFEYLKNVAITKYDDNKIEIDTRRKLIQNLRWIEQDDNINENNKIFLSDFCNQKN